MNRLVDLMSSILNGAIKAASENESLGKADEDYYEDGLLYCGKCHTPKQMKSPFVFGNADRPPIPIPCKCAEAKLDAEIEANKRQQKRLRNEEWMSDLEEIGVTYTPYATFDKSDERDSKTEFVARTFAEHFGQTQEDKNGLILLGDVGRGKTFYAECIANELTKNGYMVMYTSIRKIADMPRDEKAFVMKSVENCDLLILDDFGAERDTEYMAEQTYEIINTRYRSEKKIMVITTNLSLDEMTNEKDRTYRRIFDRVLEMCRRVDVDGPARREELAKEKASKWTNLLKAEWQRLRQKQNGG